jgi:hypothetical protein
VYCSTSGGIRLNGRLIETDVRIDSGVGKQGGH